VSKASNTASVQQNTNGPEGPLCRENPPRGEACHGPASGGVTLAYESCTCQLSEPWTEAQLDSVRRLRYEESE